MKEVELRDIVVSSMLLLFLICCGVEIVERKSWGFGGLELKMKPRPRE